MSYGNEPSSLEVTARRAPLEMEAALLLGQLLIGRSRLDLAVRSRSAGLADENLPAAFEQWSARARELEPLAQSLREGRWLPDPRRNVVLLLTAPGEPAAAARSFTIAELQQAVTQQKELLAEFHRLCAAERGLVAEPAP